MSLDLACSRLGGGTFSGAVRFEVATLGASSDEDDVPSEDVSSSSSEEEEMSEEVVDMDKSDSSQFSLSFDGEF